MRVNDRNGHDGIGITNIDFDSICIIQHTEMIPSNIGLQGRNNVWFCCSVDKPQTKPMLTKSIHSDMHHYGGII